MRQLSIQIQLQWGRLEQSDSILVQKSLPDGESLDEIVRETCASAAAAFLEAGDVFLREAAGAASAEKKGGRG